MNIAGFSRAETNDFANIINPECGQQIQRRVRLDQRVEVTHFSLAP